MKDVNKVFLMGHLGSDPTLRQTKAGLSVAQFRLATSLWASRKEEKDSQAEPETTVWHTIVTWSKTVHVAMQAAEAAARLGIEAEVVDLRTLWPWDRETVFASVARTGRLLVAHEAVQVAGFGAEIAATVAEHCDDALEAPVKRLGAPRIPIAYAPPLEDQARVTAEMLVEALQRLAGTTRKNRPTT